MLADGCEASVRAMRQKGHLSHDQIEQQVRKIINDRLQQGQLDNCDLTLKELDTIARVFVKVLSGVHHARIDYPGQQKSAEGADAAQAGAGQEGIERPRTGAGNGGRQAPGRPAPTEDTDRPMEIWINNEQETVELTAEQEDLIRRVAERALELAGSDLGTHVAVSDHAGG